MNSMTKTTIPYAKTGCFSALMCDYLQRKESLKAFYHRYPSLENASEQCKEKGQKFASTTREQLVASLEKQYVGVPTSEATAKNISALAQPTTFTVTTGHQLNLFTGPLYFLYKIFSAINLAESLQEKYPEYEFVPVYWMATEDHDFEEINYFNTHGKKIQWNRNATGPVGRLSTEGLEEVAVLFQKEIGSSKNARQLTTLFKKAYLDHETLADATRHVANELFKDYGLVILDGDSADLKAVFAPYMEEELLQQTAFSKVTETTEKLTSLGYQEQVHPREINLFYIKDGLRERIVQREDTYFVLETEIQFSREELQEELEKHPERFSPNALLRPLYQEVVLPNLCYIGGGGELAYWLQLKDYFDAVAVPFPMLLLRNSVLLSSEKIEAKLQRLNVSTEALFLPQHELKTKHTKQISEIDIDFTPQRKHLQEQFEALYRLAEQTDASFLGAVGAQEKKQLNGLDHLEKRLLKAQKRKLSQELERLTLLQDTLFPNGSLQERSQNFSEWYTEHGTRLLDVLKQELDPLVDEFTVLTL